MLPADTPSDRITHDCLAARVRLLNRQVLRIYDDALRPLGIKVTQLNGRPVCELSPATSGCR